MIQNNMWFKRKKETIQEIPISKTKTLTHKIILDIKFKDKTNYAIETTTSNVNQKTKLLSVPEFKRIYLWWMTKQTDVFALKTKENIKLLDRKEIQTIEIKRVEV